MYLEESHMTVWISRVYHCMDYRQFKKEGLKILGGVADTNGY